MSVFADQRNLECVARNVVFLMKGTLCDVADHVRSRSKNSAEAFAAIALWLFNRGLFSDDAKTTNTRFFLCKLAKSGSAIPASFIRLVAK